jgi:type IV pilus assembly protein PilB
MPLLEELVKKGLLKKEEAESLEKEIKVSGKREEDFLLDKKIIPEQDLFSLKSKYLAIPLREVKPKEVPLEILELVPQETVQHYKMVALSKKDNVLEVGMVYPEDLDAQEALKFLSRSGKFSYKVFLITPSTFNEILKKHRSLTQEVGKALERLEEELKVEKKGTAPTVAEIEKLVEEAPISKVVAVILRYSVEGKASDIHIEPGRERLRIRFRLLGSLHSSIMLPLRVHRSIVSRIKVLSNLKLDETRVPQDGRFSTKIEKKNIDFRVSTFPTTLGEKVVIRVLDPIMGLKKFKELGMAKRGSDVVNRAIAKPFGMILSTGPTGCGKTTTLYSILRILNKEGVNIVTLEDPVEYQMEGVSQSQVRPEIGYSFANGLRSILRQDPDIIMVGEIRDEETAALATHAALTGHIVLSTLHTNDSLGVIPRLVDLGIQAFLIPATLSLAIAQRLVRGLCDKCKEKVKPRKEIKDLILREVAGFPKQIKEKIKIPKPLYVWEPKGCSECNQGGFSGRIGLFEVFEMTEELAETVLKDVSEKSLREEAKRQAMITMRQDGIMKVLEGKTTIEEVLRTT